MRVTQGMLSRNFIKTMNRNIGRLSDSNRKMSSQMRYSKISENTADVARSFGVREQLYKNDQNITNIKNVEGELETVETQLRTINSMLTNISDRMLQAANGTVGESERKLIAREVSNLQDEFMHIANTQYGNKYVFSGSGKGEPPFAIDEQGNAMYNGYNINDLVTNPTTGKPSNKFPDPDNVGEYLYKDIDYNQDIYLDIGLGLTVIGSGADISIDSKSAMKVSNSGVELFGYGIDANGTPNNLYCLLGKIADDIITGDREDLHTNSTALKAQTEKLLMAITDTGVKSSSLDNTWNRIDQENINLKTVQLKLEGVPLEEESINNKMIEMSWLVTLQMGNKILPQSLFDFMR